MGFLEDDGIDRRLRIVEQVWEGVYDRMASAFADIEASHPTIDELEAGVKDESDEVGILREATYEIVQMFLLALRDLR